ncbi:hypothetical protein D3C87_1702140 [compost metagenome]
MTTVAAKTSIDEKPSVLSFLIRPFLVPEFFSVYRTKVLRVVVDFPGLRQENYKEKMIGVIRFVKPAEYDDEAGRYSTSKGAPSFCG